MSNPFNNNNESTSFEQGNPLSQVAKTAVKATLSQTNDQMKAAKKAVLDQLYGPSTGLPGSDAQKESDGSSLLEPGQQISSDSQNPTDQNKLDETRKKLQEIQLLHKRNYFEQNFGEEAQKKRMREEAKKRQEKEQEEEEKRKLEEQKKEQLDEGLASFTKRPTQFGRMKMKEPVAVTMAKTKTEINRGATG